MKKTVNMNNKLCRDLQKLMNIRKKYRLAIHLRAGHIALNHHLNKIKVENSPLCPYCHLERETSEHFLGKCPVFYYHRQNHFDTHFATLAELIKNTNLNEIIKYTIDTKRFIEDVSHHNLTNSKTRRQYNVSNLNLRACPLKFKKYFRKTQNVLKKQQTKCAKGCHLRQPSHIRATCGPNTSLYIL